MDWLVDQHSDRSPSRRPQSDDFPSTGLQFRNVMASSITVAEVYAGQGTRESKQAAKVSRLLNLFRIAYIDGSVARLGGEIARDCGTALPDALIAATAVRKGLGLATRNTSHFANIPNLNVRAPY